MTESLCNLPDSLGVVDTLLADAGYFSQNNVEACNGKSIAPYIASEREQHNPSPEDRFSEPEPLLAPADPVAEMKHRLKTLVGQGNICQEEKHHRTGFCHHQGCHGISPIPPPSLRASCRGGELGLHCIQHQEDIRLELCVMSENKGFSATV